MNDPFATAVENTPDTAPVAPDYQDGANAASDIDKLIEQIKQIPGIDEITITYKGDGQAPWVVVHGSIEAQMKLLMSPIYKELFDRIQRANQFFATKYQKPAAASQGASQGRPQGNAGGGQRRQAGPPPSSAPVVECDHGPRNHVAKNGWEALFCAAPQGTPDWEKCEPLWKDKKTGQFKAK